MNRVHFAPARTLPDTADVSQTPGSRRSAATMGILPFIGVILFAFEAISVYLGHRTAGWQHDLFQAAVVYMIGWAGIGAAVAHIVFARRTAGSIGWQASPFQFEVGLVGLACGIAALMSTSQPIAFALAVIVINSIYRVGCGVGHIREIVRSHNYALNNTTILVVDFVVPGIPPLGVPRLGLIPGLTQRCSLALRKSITCCTEASSRCSVSTE